SDAGLALRVNMISKPAIHFSAYADFDAFKLFFLDVVLVNAVGKIDAKILLEKNAILTEFKGALTEQFIVQQLVINHDLYYWTATNATAEIDLLVQYQNEIVP
ncbi:MAG TPA: ATPase, partial [Chitinophagaceae bacterium]|nr:ATPase [Chitinophagaceae bacterium]